MLQRREGEGGGGGGGLSLFCGTREPSLGWGPSTEGSFINLFQMCAKRM